MARNAARAPRRMALQALGLGLVLFLGLSAHLVADGWKQPDTGAPRVVLSNDLCDFWDDVILSEFIFFQGVPINHSLSIPHSALPNTRGPAPHKHPPRV